MGKPFVSYDYSYAVVPRYPKMESFLRFDLKTTFYSEFKTSEKFDNFTVCMADTKNGSGNGKVW